MRVVVGERMGGPEVLAVADATVAADSMKMTTAPIAKRVSRIS